LRQAVHKLWRGWTWHRWPTVEEIEEALKEVASEKSYAYLDEIESGSFCPECANVGRNVEYIDGFQKETYCSCVHGTGWKKLRKKQGFVVADDTPKIQYKEKLPYKDADDGIPF